MFYNYNDDYQYDSCISKGICSINPRTSSLREVLVMYLKHLAFYTIQLNHFGVKNNSTEKIILNTLSGLMSNLETGNKEFYQTLINLKSIIIDSIETYKNVCKTKGIKPKKIKANIKLNKNLNITDLIRLGEGEFSQKLKSLSDEKRNLYEIIFLVMKSICINLVELKSFGIDNNKAYIEILNLLNTINYPEIPKEILIKKINKSTEIDYILSKKLHETKIKHYGYPDEVEVSYTTVPNKAILVAGTNLQELKKVLDATEGLNIDVYTHGEMIMAYTYPKFREYKHLKGQYGKGVESCLLDFATFPGAILIAKHALENIEYLYRGRLFTTDNFVPQGVIQIKDDDYSQLINSALSARGFKHGKIRESVKIGYNNQDLENKLAKIINNIDNYKNIIILGTDAYSYEQNSYYNSIIRYANKETVIISISKEFQNKKTINVKTTEFYMVYLIKQMLKEVIKDYDIKLSLFLAKCDKHTISNIINLKRLGIDNIYLSKCTPVMLNPTLTKTLQELYKINPTNSAIQDLKDLGIFDNT